MKSADREGFEEALKDCANERIHQIGHIQPHGATLVFETDAPHTVRQVSENIASFLDPGNGIALGQPLAALLGEPATSQTLNLVRATGKKQTAAGVLQLTSKGETVHLQAHLYAAGSQWALELEHDEGTHQENHLARLQLQFQQTLLEFDSDADLTQYLNEVAKLVRRLTGYDSVMVYRFNERWDGEIIAQDRVDAAPSYLGHHFPASDIPPQARRLYATNLVRIVTDVNAQPVPILPVLNEETGEPLDMTYSALRSLSPIHLEYLRNIGVSASMVVSLMQDGQLWGMVACHHLTPKRVSIAVRESAIFISRMISSKLSGIAAIEQRAKVDQANSLVNELVKFIATDDESVMLQKLLPRLTQVVDANGVIVVIDGQPHAHGTVPDTGSVLALLDWLGNSSSAGELFVTDELGQQFPPALSYADVASGLLATALNRDIRSGIVWLRREKPRTVNWAGNYQSGLTQNAAGNFRLTPRKSFEIWCETWQGRSEPWSHADTGIAAMLGLSVPEALNKKHKLEAEQAKFRQAHQVSESSLQQFNKLTGAVPGVVYQFLVTPNGSWTYLYLSTYVRELFEVSPEDAYCDHSIMTSCIVEEHRESHHASIQAAAKNLTPWVHEHVIQTQSGSLKWVLGQALPEMQTDGSVLWHGIMTDITERKRAEEALRLTASVFAHAREGITVTDVEGSIVDINAAFSRITGYDRADVLGQNPRFLQSGKQDKAFYVAMWRDLIGQGYWEGEIWNRRKNGEVYPERLAIAAVRDAKGNTRQYVAMFSDISERKRIELELLKSEQKFRLVAENTSDGITIFGKNRTIEYVSPSVVKQLGYAESEELGRSNADVYALIHPESRDALFQTLNEAIENKSPSMTYSYRIKHKAGHYIWREDSTNFRYTSNGDYDGAYVVSRDITERKQAELELVRSKNRYQGILNNMMDAYWRIDANGRIVEANPAICQMHGYAKEELLQMSISDVEVIESAEDTRERIATIMREGRIAFQSQHRCSDGRIIDVEIAANLASDMPGAIDGFHHDITERKAMENDIRKLAFHDPLTQLPNRRLLRDRLGQMMATNKRSGFYGSVMFLDLDNFKPLNDVHGHDVGDLLLIETADRLKACVREMDTVARFGGDEFVVMIGELVADEVESKVHARNVAEKIRVALSGPYRLTINHDRPGNTTVTHNCTASIGVALFVNHDASPDEVLKWADAAMYKAKQDGRNLIRFHEQDGRETT